MSKEDVKLNFITPALQKAGWTYKMTMETAVKLTAGQIVIDDGPAHHKAPKRADYDYHIVIQGRINQVAYEITRYLKAHGRMEKTIVFCANEDAAQRMRDKLVELNEDMCSKNPDYVVRITGSDVYGKGKLDYFCSKESPYPVIATTSQLLSTGVDCKTVKLIAIDKNINSMTEFKQIIGRGTRVVEGKGKMEFAVMDFRGVARLFADSKWDGPVEQVDGFGTNEYMHATGAPRAVGEDKLSYAYKPYVDENGCNVKVINKSVSVYDPDGKLLHAEEFVDCTKQDICGKYSSLHDFIADWSKPVKRKAIKDELRRKGIRLDELKSAEGLSDADDFDFLCHIAFDVKPLSRKQRVKLTEESGYLDRYSGAAREVLEILLDKYADAGPDEIEEPLVLQQNVFHAFGKPQKIMSLYGGMDKYEEALSELVQILYSVEMA